MYQKAKQLDFFLGLISCPSKKGEGYEWGDLLIKKNKTPSPFSSEPSFSSEKKKEAKKKEVKVVKPKKRKTPVPKKVKNDSWDIYIGKEFGQAYCIVCDRTKIDSKCFQAGHIVSDKNGGKCTIDNIIPICGGCNQSMGALNMREYVRKNYPVNLEKFDKKNYRK
jgi:5-methylcytosine-specific restriction endonuclease McrA